MQDSDVEKRKAALLKQMYNLRKLAWIRINKAVIIRRTFEQIGKAYLEAAVWKTISMSFSLPMRSYLKLWQRTFYVRSASNLMQELHGISRDKARNLL